jgi:hypothetical protein
MRQLAGGEPLSPTILNASTAFPFGLCNDVETVGHLIAQRPRPSSTDSEFMGMTDYVTESFYDLLMGDSKEIFDSDTSRGSHHPSCECFRAEGAHRAKTPEGHVANVHEGEVTPPSDSDDKVEANGRVPPSPWLEQLRAQQQELKDA